MIALQRIDYVLAVLAEAGGSFTPVQLQKMFFILEKKAAAALGGPFFDFTPYNYGPFDAAVYGEVEKLAEKGYAFVSGVGTTSRLYGVTAAGATAAAPILDRIAPPTRAYFKQLADYVRSLSFAQLVSAVYKEWPEMKANSIFASS